MLSLKSLEKKLKSSKIEVSMRNSIKISLFTLLLPLAANQQFNIDDRAYRLEEKTPFANTVVSFHDSYALSDAEIVVESAAKKSFIKSEQPPIAVTSLEAPTEVMRKPAIAKVKQPKSFRSKFSGYRSSFRELEKYWPTKNENPIAKKEVKLAKLVKLEIPRPVLVKKLDLNKEAISNLDKKFAFIAAAPNDYIEQMKEVDGKVVPVKISLLTMEIKNHLEGQAIAKAPQIPTLAVETFKEEKLNRQLAFLDEDDELDRLITEYKQDQVKMAQSSIKKNKQGGKKTNSQNDDLVFIDLDKQAKSSTKPVEKSKPVKTLAEKLASAEIVTSHSPIKQAAQPKPAVAGNNLISQSVKDAIDRTLKQVKPSRNELLAAMGKSFATGKKAKPTDFAKFIAAVASPEAMQQEKSVGQPFAMMRPLLIDLEGKKKSQSLHEFDVIPSYNLNDVLTDAGEGKLKIEYPLFSDKGLFHGSVVHRDTVRVNFEVALGSEENEYSVPVFELSQFNEYLTKNNASEPGGFVLVEYSEGVESVDIEKYAKVLNLNSKFQVLKENERPDYSLYVGVEAGNVLLRVLNDKGEIGEKVIFAYEDELTFTTTHYENSKKLKFALYKESLLGKKSPLALDSKSVQYFNLPINPERQTMNTYSMQAPPLLEGMRRYLEVKSGNDLFIIGTDNGGDLSIPTRKTLDFYLGEVNLSDFESSCIVQVNTGKPIESVQIDGITRRGPMYLSTHFLNDDGQLYKNVDGVVRKAFITGDYQGTLYLNLRYVDGTEEVARSYCSPGTYVIENF